MNDYAPRIQLTFSFVTHYDQYCYYKRLLNDDEEHNNPVIKAVHNVTNKCHINGYLDSVLRNNVQNKVHIINEIEITVT